ncbi:MAG: UDP-N-acetylglucosamine--N-acetylmuramyl-(pentapeptide) pyrophosphoryl-undecaprenol N-acetylglucosamine transferase [Verrucomicrobiota bacterium]
MSNILIACGGTGGHLAPGIAVAEILMERGHGCLLLISKKQVDSKLVEKYKHLRFERTPGRAFAGGVTARLGSILSLVEGFFFSRKQIKEKRPDLVFLFGGFLSVGLCLAAKLSGIPVVLHEANAHPGRAVRLIKRFATRLYLPEGVQLEGVSSEQVRHYGYPVRREIRCVPKEEARQRLGLHVPRKFLVVIGGSQGAKALNEWVIQNFTALAEKNVSVYCVSGMGGVSLQDLKQVNQAGEAITATFVPFSDAMGEVISAADLVLSRAGAGSIAEIIRCRAPSILIPYPYAADDHQRANAELHAEQNAGCWMDQDLIETELMGEVTRLIFDEKTLADFRSKMEQIDAYDSSKRIADDIETLCLEQTSIHKKELEPSI